MIIQDAVAGPDAHPAVAGMSTVEHRALKSLEALRHTLIPGGCHTYAKGDDQYPENAPPCIVRGQGCYVWDSDGNEYIEYGMGLRSVTLGHSYRPVVEAAYRQMLLGTNFTRPAPIEVECAEQLLSLIAPADMVKFTKDGSTATTAAVKLARAYTGREMVALCRDHPFFSYDDWFIGTTATSAGIPQAVSDLSVTFRYNDLDSVRSVFDLHRGKIACLIMEAAREVEPVDGFLRGVRNLCASNGTLFILDETITGFRWHLGGAQAFYNLDPDLSIFGKGLANGFALSALLGRREIMELGGIHHDQQRVFLLSTTHGAETHALAAAMETMRIYRDEQVIPCLYRQGERLRRHLNRAIEARRLGDYFAILGNPTNLVFETRDTDGRPSQAFRTLFLQETIRRGVLAPSLVISYSHSDEDIDRTVDAVAEALLVYRKALEEGVDRYLVGRPVKPVNRSHN